MLTPIPALAIEVVPVAVVLWVVLGHNARLNLRVVVASVSGAARQPRVLLVAMHLRQLLMVLAPTWTLTPTSASIQAELSTQSPVVQSSVSRRPQIQHHTPAPSHDAACHIAVRGQAVPHDESQHLLVPPW